jgi:exodeoxyribonuclease I
MADQPTFFWYDLETSGVDPRWQRIVQFAGIRTDLELNEVEPTAANYVKLPMDVLPEPGSCVVTGLTPQRVNEKGVPELEAHVAIQRAFTRPNTCVAGFNNLRFDDEFIRYGFYRHLIDPYAYAWQNGNSRWDLIDLVRAAAALRPDGIEWPREEGLVTFRLAALCAANGIVHASVHDASSDVRATVAVARLVRAKQRRLFDFYLTLRDRKRVTDLLSVEHPRLVVHVSGRIGRERGNLALVVPIARHPTNGNSVVVVDASRDVDMLFDLDVDSLRERLFTRGDHERPPLKEVRLNRVPFVAPLGTLRDSDAIRLGIDRAAAERRCERLVAAPDLAAKVQSIYSREPISGSTDVDAALYDGFYSDSDRSRCASALDSLLENRTPDLDFEDERPVALIRRLRARRDFRALAPLELEEWRADVKQRLHAGEARWMTIERFRSELDQLTEPSQEQIRISLQVHLSQLQAWLRGEGS